MNPHRLILNTFSTNHCGSFNQLSLLRIKYSSVGSEYRKYQNQKNPSWKGPLQVTRATLSRATLEQCCKHSISAAGAGVSSTRRSFLVSCRTHCGWNFFPNSDRDQQLCLCDTNGSQMLHKITHQPTKQRRSHRAAFGSKLSAFCQRNQDCSRCQENAPENLMMVLALSS